MYTLSRGITSFPSSKSCFISVPHGISCESRLSPPTSSFNPEVPPIPFAQLLAFELFIKPITAIYLHIVCTYLIRYGIVEKKTEVHRDPTEAGFGSETV